MAPIPTNRTTANTAAEHVVDHNTVHGFFNAWDGITPSSKADATALATLNASVSALAATIISLASTAPVALGTAAVGTGTTSARSDHVHPTTGLALLATSNTLTKAQYVNPTEAAVTEGAALDHGRRAIDLAFDANLRGRNRDSSKSLFLIGVSDGWGGAITTDYMVLGDSRMAFINVQTSLDMIGKDITDTSKIGNNASHQGGGTYNTRFVQQAQGAWGGLYTVGLGTDDNAEVYQDRLVINNRQTVANSFVRVQNAGLRLHYKDMATNRLPSADRDFESSVGSWVLSPGYVGTSLVRTTSSPIAGTGSGQVETSAQGNMAVNTVRGGGGVVVTGEADFSCTVRAKTRTTAREFAVTVEEWDGFDNLISSTTSAWVSDSTASTGVANTVTGRTRPSTVRLSVQVVWRNIDQLNEQHLWDSVDLFVDDLSVTAPDVAFRAIAARTSELDGVTKMLNQTAPADTPSGGGYFYAEGGALKWKGSAGTVTTLAPA